MKIAQQGGEEPMVTEEQVKAIFSNTVEILEIHHNLLDRLIDALEHWYPLYNMGLIYSQLVRCRNVVNTFPTNDGP